MLQMTDDKTDKTLSDITKIAGRTTSYDISAFCLKRLQYFLFASVLASKKCEKKEVNDLALNILLRSFIVSNIFMRI